MSKPLRQFHRWMSIAFTLCVVANFVQMAIKPGQPPNVVTYSPLLPLFVLWFTGLYLFALPYLGRAKSSREQA